mmetsp:Transcript_6574/g.9941  ORF Transcript_6574/g.9941 Transcript_6574/m.9941 type:complete len:96 (-) Transcript_6574:120-407(-)
MKVKENSRTSHSVNSLNIEFKICMEDLFRHVIRGDHISFLFRGDNQSIPSPHDTLHQCQLAKRCLLGDRNAFLHCRNYGVADFFPQLVNASAYQA